MSKYTVRVQEVMGGMVTPVHVDARNIDEAIDLALDHLLVHGAVHHLDVYEGHEGWYSTDERLASGHGEWSQSTPSDRRIKVLAETQDS